MKKLFYLIVFFIASSVALSACTEEEIAPANQENGGGTASDPR